MPLNTTATIARWWSEAEVEVSQEIDFLFERYEIPVILGTNTYVLPDYCKSIRRITWLGKELSPLPHRNLNDIFVNTAQQGTPFWYTYDNVGRQKIILFPTPNQTLTGTGIDPWYADIPTQCIVEYVRISDNSSFRVPPYLRPQLLKKYVGKRMFQVEGPGQSIKNATIYAKLWDQGIEEFRQWVQEMIGKPRKIIIAGDVGGNFLPAEPVMPISRYGIPVDTGY